MGIFTDKDTKDGESEFNSIFRMFERRLMILFLKGYKLSFKFSKKETNMASFKRMATGLKENPIENPGEFGYGLGLFFGYLKYQLPSILASEENLKIMIETIRYLKTMEGFDFRVVTKRLKRTEKDVARLSPEKIKQLKYIISESQR